MKPEKCVGLKEAKEGLISEPGLGRVECDRRKCSAIIGFSKSGQKTNSIGIPHIVGGIPRCGDIAVTADKVQKKLKRVFFPLSEETEARLKEEYNELKKEAEGLGIVESTSNTSKGNSKQT
jgi:hypothetical protein